MTKKRTPRRRAPSEAPGYRLSVYLQPLTRKMCESLCKELKISRSALVAMLIAERYLR